MRADPDRLIPLIQQSLHRCFGPLNWWPAESPYEVLVGTILTQNTAWNNVEHAIENLRQARMLSALQISQTPTDELEKLIKPAGYYRQKALRLKSISEYILEHWGGDVTQMCSGSVPEARKRLLSLCGIGPETADSILLYAAQRPSFVVDAYTRRIFERLGLFDGTETYDEIRNLFMSSLDEDVALFNEYHAAIVTLGKRYCRKSRPLCCSCPIQIHCRYPREKGHL